MEEGKEPAGLLLLMEKASNGDRPVDAPKPDPDAGLAAKAAKPPPEVVADPKMEAESPPPPPPKGVVVLGVPKGATGDPNVELPPNPSVEGCPKAGNPNADGAEALGFPKEKGVDGVVPSPRAEGCPKAGEPNEDGAPLPKLSPLADPEPNTGVASWGAAISCSDSISFGSRESGGVGGDRSTISKGSAGRHAIPCTIDVWGIRNASGLFWFLI
jgi:hypothetical protein